MKMTTHGKNLNETNQTIDPSSNYKRVSERVQQWNRSIPEAGYITLGTIRYGIRLSNPNITNLTAAIDDNNSINSNYTSSNTTNSSNINSSNNNHKNCCCIGSNGLVLPWTNNYVRTRLPVPTASHSSKNRTTSPSSSSSVKAAAVVSFNRESSPTTSACCYNKNSKPIQTATNKKFIYSPKKQIKRKFCCNKCELSEYSIETSEDEIKNCDNNKNIDVISDNLCIKRIDDKISGLILTDKGDDEKYTTIKFIDKLTQIEDNRENKNTRESWCSKTTNEPKIKELNSECNCTNIKTEKIELLSCFSSYPVIGIEKSQEKIHYLDTPKAIERRNEENDDHYDDDDHNTEVIVEDEDDDDSFGYIDSSTSEDVIILKPNEENSKSLVNKCTEQRICVSVNPIVTHKTILYSNPKIGSVVLKNTSDLNRKENDIEIQQETRPKQHKLLQQEHASKLTQQQQQQQDILFKYKKFRLDKRENDNFTLSKNSFKSEKCLKETIDESDLLKQENLNKLLTVNSSSSFNCFGKSQVYVRLSPNKSVTMEKRRNTLDRLQKLGFGRRSIGNPSSENKTHDKTNKKSTDKTERLKELTELLKGSRTPPVPPPRRPRHSHSIDQPIYEVPTTYEHSVARSADDEYDPLRLEDFTDSPPSTLPKSNRIFNMNSTASPNSLYKKLRPNTSISNLEHIMLSRENSRESEKNTPPIALKEDDLFVNSPRVEPKTIIGSYTQKSIPFRSASFSQVDYTSGKYIRSALGAIKAAFRKDKEVSVVDRANLTLPRRKDGSRSASPSQFSLAQIDDGFPPEETSKSLKKSELNINLVSGNFENLTESNIDHDPSVVWQENKIHSSEFPVEYIDESNENNSIFEPDIQELPTDIELHAEMNVAQTSEITLETLAEEEIPIGSSIDDSFLQTATTCLIPVPVYECAAREWNSTHPQSEWIIVSEEEEIPKMIEELGISLNMIEEINEIDISSAPIETELIDLIDQEDISTEIIANENCGDLLMVVSCCENVESNEVNIEEASKKERVLIKQENIDELTKRSNDAMSSFSENMLDFDEKEKYSDEFKQNLHHFSEEKLTEKLNDVVISSFSENMVNSDESEIYSDEFKKNLEQLSEEKHAQEELQCAVSEYVEVRKRHSNNQENNRLEKSLECASASNETAFVTTSTNIGDERRRVDKSRRRKGIYIQWPTVNKNCEGESDEGAEDSLTPEESKIAWQCDKITQEVFEKSDLGSCDFSSIKPIPNREKNNFILLTQKPSDDIRNTGSQCSIGSESECNRTVWTKYQRRQSLTCQSSDEKDDPTMMSTSIRPFKNLQFIRSDSTSDNESDKTPPRERSSTSPAPHDQDLKRYSKRPLRGPYGQMLEAEMKKPAKLHYDELLEELNRCENLNNLSLDETNSSLKIPKSRKSSANLPVPCHVRAASTPSKMEPPSQDQLVLHHKRYPSSIEQFTLKESERKQLDCPKKLSLDSNFDKSICSSSEVTEKFTNRNSASSGEKSKRNFDEIRLSQVSRTLSERSVVLNTPEIQKSALVATPELLAELLKGSSERLASESRLIDDGSGSNTLPTAVLRFLDTRTHVVVELYNTEQSYVESLQTVIVKYLNPLKSSENAGIVDAQIVDEIFFKVPAILNLHERFLEELRRRLDTWDPQQKVGDAFVEVFSKVAVLETYTSFVNNWNRAKDAIRSTSSTRPAFAKFLEAMTREHKRKLSLDNLLIKPVQKFPNYELILQRLIKHTDVDHPDQKPLQDALKLVHDILMHLNCKEREALENGQREATLRELEGVIEGISDLVSMERIFLLFELVSIPSSGQATRKERGFFLFNDILVITSIKRRSGTIRKPNITCPGSVAQTLDTNKYKFLTKMALDDLEIVKAKDENIRKIMKEIEQLSEDCNKIQQISELASSLRYPHQILEDSIRDLQRDVQRQLSDRQSNDTQLSIIELTLNSPNGIQNMSVVFQKQEKRTQWEETFNEAKQKLAATLERHPVPEFINSIPIRKTRAGLQFTCAAPTLGSQHDVWVCNSDGYVGQVCVMSLVPEPTVTSCNGVCNARIMCIASVPANIESSNPSHGVSISIEDTTRLSQHSISNSCHSVTSDRKSNSNKNDSSDIQLDSGSSSEDSETECHPERVPSPAVVSQHQHQESNPDDCHQPTMWLGTEDGCIHVYNCTDNIRTKKNKIKIQHITAVFSILYIENRVFVSLANGDICVYLRDHCGWNTTTPLNISIGTVTSPITKLVSVQGKLWCAIQGIIKVLNISTLQTDNQIQISSDSKPITNMAVSNNCVWISIQNSAIIKCFHSISYELIFEVNLAPAVNKMLSSCDDIIRQHKAACLRVTSLLACKDLIWVGTSAGVLLTIPAQSTNKGPLVTGIPHGHTGHVRFLTFVEDEKGEETAKSHFNRHSIHTKQKSDQPNILIISGGDGYEDFRSSGTNLMSEVAGREDSTNHLLLWHV